MLVSVIIPAFNAERYIGACLDSVLHQTHDELEVIVVDDGSTDGTAAVAESTGDARVRVDRGPNRGVAAARNRGLALANGELVAFLDADDLWFPDKLAQQVRRLEDEDLAAVGAVFQYVSGEGRFLGRIGQDPRGPSAHRQLQSGRLMPFPISSLVARASTVRSAGGFDESLPPVEDLDLMTRLALAGPVATIMQPLGAYRVHSNSASARHHAKMKMLTRFVEARATARLEGRPLPSLESFVASYRLTFGQRRRDRAARWFRDAGLQAIERKYFKASVFCALAFAGRPSYTLRRIGTRLSIKRALTEMISRSPFGPAA